MRVLTISHSCVTDVNQQLFVDLQNIPDVEVALIVPAKWRNDYCGRATFHPQLLDTVSFPVYKLPVAVPGNIQLHFYSRLPVRELRAFRPDVLLSTQEPWSLSGFQAQWLARRLAIPLVFQTNQNILKNYPFPFGWIESRSFKTAAVALAFSEEARQVMVRKGVRCASGVVPYGTDVRLFYAGKSPELRERLGLTDSVVVGYMGRLVEEKGLDTLVEVIDIMRRHPSKRRVRVLLVGSGAAEPALREMIRARDLEDAFIFAGSVPHAEAGDYMRCMDVFALPSRTTPSWKEQFGRVIIEAMACGIPVVGSDSGEIPNLLRTTGGGLVFGEGDADELAGHLQCLVNNAEVRERLGRNGSEAVRSRYTYEAVARQLHSHLEAAILTHSKPCTTR